MSKRIIDLSNGGSIPRPIYQASQPIYNIQSPSYVQRNIAPFENVKKVQEVSTQVSPPQVKEEEKEKVIVNGCDITGCTRVLDAYNKNAKKMRFVRL